LSIVYLFFPDKVVIYEFFKINNYSNLKKLKNIILLIFIFLANYFKIKINLRKIISMRRNKIREDDIQTVFSYFDKNGDQTIDQDEFSQACDHLDLGFNEQEKKAMFE
jgi:hypothetical protein